MGGEVDEYQLEINEIRRTLARLKADKADAALIDEYEAELRNLRALYQAAIDTLQAGRGEPRMRAALGELGFGDWTLQNVYSFVYDAAMAAEPDERDLANVITHTDYATSLLDAAEG
jgi:signal transduction histidine kinase